MSERPERTFESLSALSVAPIARLEYIEARSQTPMMTPKKTITRATLVRREARKMHMKAPVRGVSRGSAMKEGRKLTIPDPEEGCKRLVFGSNGRRSSGLSSEGSSNIEGGGENGAVAVRGRDVSPFLSSVSATGSPQVEAREDSKDLYNIVIACT